MSEDLSSADPSGNVLPLDGVRVIDLSQVAAGPYGTSLLGDFGADVIKVEPIAGDSLRGMDEGFGVGQSAYFFGVNRSKRSIALDLKSSGGFEVLTRLVSRADVIVVAYRPQALARLGIDYESLRAINPRLIYVSITAFGEQGPRADQPGMDILAQALSGMMGVTGEVGGGPVKVGAPIADFTTSFLLGFAVASALRLRDRTGCGERISISLLDALLATFANYATPFDRLGLTVERQGGAHPQIVPYQPFLDCNGKYFIVACLNDKFWQLLVDVLAPYADFADPRLSTNSARVADRQAICDRLQEVFRTAPTSMWLQKLEAAGVPCGPINDLADALSDPQAIANNSVLHLEHPVHGPYLVLNNPIRFEASKTGPRGYAPSLGEHTTEILEELGYSACEVEGLEREGSVKAQEVR